ncbi:MAG: hypothetical protein QOE06_1602 [Thermoleophilaceae bacterium]|jgi:hypothetical protein|nr:hypothetical protein [Thermoleophilaceae bacterium]
MKSPEIVRWPVEPLPDAESLHPGPDDAALAMAATAIAMPAGAPLRRVVLTRAVQIGLAAVGRRDYEAWRRVYAPNAEFYLTARDWLALGLLPELTHGCENGWRNQAGILDAIAELRIEPRELIDPGHSRFATRVLISGRGRESGLAMHMEHWYVWFLENLLIAREYGVATEEEAVGLLRTDQPSS